MKRALITGGSGDIGSAICKKLAANGIHTIIHANTNRKKAEKTVTNIEANGGSAEITSFDITNADQCEEILTNLIAEAPIQILVNNAGIYDDAPLAGMSREKWRHVIDVSLNGFYNVTQPILLPMIKTRWGRIVSVTSISAIKGNRGQANYAAAKSGVFAASKSLSQELASRKITVNCVAPGIIEGRINDLEFDNKAIKQMVPMQRAGTPDEVAALVAFLVSDDAAYISGQSISIDGAMS